MSYTLLAPDQPTANKSIGDLTSPSSLSAGERMPCGSITHTGVTVNASGQLVLATNKTFIIWGSPLIEDNSTPHTGTMTAQWYDVTNSQYIGRDWRGYVGTDSQVSHARSSFARCVIAPSVTTTIEFRITAIDSQVDTVNPTSTGNHWSTHTPYIGTQYYAILSF